MTAARRRYRAQWPARCALVAACYAAVRHEPHAVEAHAEASAAASLLVCAVVPRCTILCGELHTATMPEPCAHFWVYDLAARVHIDLTAERFAGTPRGVAVFAADERMAAYTLGSANTFDAAMRAVRGVRGAGR